MNRLITHLKGIAVIAAVMIAASSCTKKTVEEPSMNSKILGSWTMEHINIQNYEDGKLLSERKLYATEGASLILEFKEGGEGCALNLDGSNPTPEAYKWKLIGDSLILFFESDASHIDVLTLTNDMLDLSLMNETYDNGVKKGVRYVIALRK